MNIPLYCMIFLSKVLENALATLRLIVVANGKKWLGAILQFIVALVWVFVTGVVVIDIGKDPFKIIVFAVGSFVGSYVGCLIEEKLALGNNMITAIVNQKNVPFISTCLKQNRFKLTQLESNEKEKVILMILIPRKKRQEVIDIITKFEPNAFMSAEKVAPITPNL